MELTSQGLYSCCGKWWRGQVPLLRRTIQTTLIVSIHGISRSRRQTIFTSHSQLRFNSAAQLFKLESIFLAGTKKGKHCFPFVTWTILTKLDRSGLAFGDSLHAQANTALSIHLKHLDLNHVAFRQLVADVFDTFVRNLRDMHQSILTG